jgi:hypothetical protein
MSKRSSSLKSIFVVALGMSVCSLVLASTTQTNRTQIPTVFSSPDFRSVHRIGAELQVAGPNGLAGVHLGFNLNRIYTVMVGFGGSEDFQSIQAEWRRYIEAKNFSPYLLFGAAKWSSIGERDPIQKTNPGFLADRLMNDRDKARGIIDEVLLYPGFGINYQVLEGDMKGLTVFANIVMLADIKDFQAAPSATLGSGFYF